MQLDTQPAQPALYPGCRRRHPRAIVSAPLTLHHLASGGVQKSPGITLDLSESGIGAIVQSSLHVGDTVKIDLRLPGCTLRAVAVVRHTSSVRSGFEFVGLTAEERQQITAACGHS